MLIDHVEITAFFADAECGLPIVRNRFLATFCGVTQAQEVRGVREENTAGG